MKIAVIGSGVIGYCTAISLLKEGKEVIIYTKDNSQKNPENIVSIVACALWQPYKLYKNLDDEPESTRNKTLAVSKSSLEEFYRLSQKFSSDVTGIFKKNHYEYSSVSINKNNRLKNDFYYIKLLEEFWKSKGERNYILREKKINAKNYIYLNNSNSPIKYLHGYKTFIIDSPLFLKFLHKQFIKLGGKIKIKLIKPNHLKDLKEKVIFNCTGLNGFQTLSKNNQNNYSKRKIVAKKGVLLLYKLKNTETFCNTLVMDELTVLCRKDELTLGTGEIQKDGNSSLLINRLQKYVNQIINNPGYDDFGLKTFLLNNKIEFDKPNKTLVGSRPYFEDGKGYFLNNFQHPNETNPKFSLYNNFGHGGSGVTLCWGTAFEICKLFSNNTEKHLNSLNLKRANNNVCKFSVEFSHFDFKEIRKLSNEELMQSIKHEYNLMMIEFKLLGINRNEYSISVLIDNKEKRNDRLSEARLLSCLKEFDVDYIAYEKYLVEYLNQLDQFLPFAIK